jgi:hypothetical protein
MIHHAASALVATSALRSDDDGGPERDHPVIADQEMPDTN